MRRTCCLPCSTVLPQRWWPLVTFRRTGGHPAEARSSPRLRCGGRCLHSALPKGQPKAHGSPSPPRLPREEKWGAGSSGRPRPVLAASVPAPRGLLPSASSPGLCGPSVSWTISIRAESDRRDTMSQRVFRGTQRHMGGSENSHGKETLLLNVRFLKHI